MDRLQRIFAGMLGILALVASIFAGTEIQLPEGTQPNLSADFYRLAGTQSASQMAMQVVNSDASLVQLLFSDPPVTLEPVTLDGQDYVAPRMSGEGSTLDPGLPDLPRVTRLVMIANTGNVQLAITNQSYTVQPLEHAPAPTQPLAGDDGSLDETVAYNSQVYGTDDWYPSQIAEITPPATLRDVRFVVVVTYPVQVNPVTHEMRVYDNIEVALNNIGGVGENEITVTPLSLSPNFKKLYTEFANFPGSPLDALPVVPGKQLIVCPDAAGAIAEVNRLVDWRRRKGIDASYVTTTTTGPTAAQIRSYIASQYASSNGQLEFVMIVGDPNAAAIYDLPSGGGQLDNYYGTVGTGNPDPVPDLAVGRLPVNTDVELNTLVTKILLYESDPYLADTTWFTRAWCYSHYNIIPSNPSTKRYTQQIMLQHGMTTVNFDSVSGYVNTATLNTRVNQGVCVVNHRLSWIGERRGRAVGGRLESIHRASL